MKERKRPLNSFEVNRLRKDGHSIRAIARMLDYNPSCVCRNIQKWDLAEQRAAAGPAGQELVVVESSLNRRLDLLGEMRERHDTLTRDLAKMQHRKQEQIPEATRQLVETRELAVMAELRKLEALYIEVAKVIYELIERRAYNQMVLEEVNRESPECRERIHKRWESLLDGYGIAGGLSF